MVDVLIVGGGLIGTTLSLALTQLGYSTKMVDAHPPALRVKSDFDARSLALAPASVRILQMLNVWPHIEQYACPIRTIHVSEQAAFGSVHLHQANEPLGFVIEIQALNEALYSLLQQEHFMAPARLTAIDAKGGLATIQQGEETTTIQAQLIVAADGAESTVRQLCHLSTETKDYQQHALVANIGLARKHHHIAYERFTATGPMALLPMSQQRASLIWCLPALEAKRLSQCAEPAFLKTLQNTFGYRLGRFIKVGQRVNYPLHQMRMHQQYIDHVVFIGNAAHTLHPIAGQGFNLGLRDVAMLAQCITEYGLGQNMLQRYQEKRKPDHRAITTFTDKLVDIFSHPKLSMSFVRSMGLVALDNTVGLKTLLARYARGYAGITPDLVCGIPLVKP